VYAEDYDQIILATIMNLTPMMTRRVPNRTGSFCHVPHTSLVEHWRSPLAVCDRVQLTRTCAGPGRPLADTAEWPSNSVLLSVAAANGLSVAAANGLSCDVANRNASAISFYRIRLGPGGVALALKRCR